MPSTRAVGDGRVGHLPGASPKQPGQGKACWSRPGVHGRDRGRRRALGGGGL